MFAVIKAGGKQYRVAADDVITINRLGGEPGDLIAFDDVLLLERDGTTEFGAPSVAGVTVAGEVVAQLRGEKVIAFKKRRRQNSKRKRGHRQLLTKVRITEILTGGEKPTARQKGEAAPRTRVAAETAGEAPTDVSLISGIGEGFKEKLEAAGITSLAQIADWTEADVAKYDADLELGGRITRDEWVEQARELRAGKSPRAASDKERAERDRDD